jgi:cytochrome P450
MQPGPSHSNQRRMLRKSIGPQRVPSYYGMIETEMAKLTTELHNIKGSPINTIRRHVDAYLWASLFEANF